MFKKKWLSILLLILCLVLLFFGFLYPCCTTVSSVLAIIVACVEMNNSWKTEKKLESYDKALQTKYDSNLEINGMTFDSGTYDN